MQFATLLSILTSTTLASASVIQNRQTENATVAVITAWDHYTPGCPEAKDSDANTIEVGSNAINKCVPFAEGYKSLVVTGFNEGQLVPFFYTNTDCSAGEDVLHAPGKCGSIEDGQYLSYSIRTPVFSA